jgi:hypothetical protein
LVVLPSRKTQTAYLLAIRRLHSAGLGDVAMLDNKHPDTNMCYVHGLLPIAPLNVTGPNPFSEATIASIIAQLRRRDTWALTGEAGKKNPDAYANAVEEAESSRAARERQTMKDNFYHMGRDAWRSLKARLSSRNKRASDHHGVARRRQSQPVKP